jgi:two-component system cell cycle response regulator DivK
MKKILIADDKATSRELLRTVLERQGYEVMEAADGEEALQKALAEVPDLILLDLQMPRRTGYEVLGELRKDARHATLPIIALTASAMRGDRERALAAGFTSYMAKPVPLVHLREEVQRLLQKKEKRLIARTTACFHSRPNFFIL